MGVTPKANKWTIRFWPKMTFSLAPNLGQDLTIFLGHN